MPARQSGSVRIQDHFAELTDPRRRKVTYPLVNLVVICVCAVICGADDFVAIATANHISLGQVVTEANGNEITAIPKLLEMLEIEGSLITIDAMGCQTAIAAQIVDQKADYALTVKGNQPTLQQGIIDDFAEHHDDDFARTKVRRHETQDKGHGRLEDRWYSISPVPDDLQDRERWKNLKAIGMAVSCILRDGKECCEVRYSILSKYLSCQRFAKAVRGHWQLDVTFQEDKCPIPKGHADRNFRTLRRTAFSLLKNEFTEKVGIKNKRLLAAWDETYLEKVLMGKHLNVQSP